MPQFEDFWQLWKEIDCLQECGDDVDPQEIMALIQHINSSFEINRITEDERHHFLGYIGYHFNEYLVEQIDYLQEFTEAVRLNDKSSWSWLYLGYSYFDIEKWESALAAFDRIEDLGNPPILLKLKIEELKLASRLRTEPQVAIVEIDRFLDQLAVVLFDEKAFPTELKVAIEESEHFPFLEQKRLLERIHEELDL